MNLDNVSPATKQVVVDALLGMTDSFADQQLRLCVRQGDLAGAVARLETLRDDYYSQTRQQLAVQMAAGDPHFMDAFLASNVLVGIDRMLAISI